MFMDTARGPSHCATRSGSVWARNTLAGGASNSRVIRTSGTQGSAVMVTSRVAVLVMAVLLLSLDRVVAWVRCRPAADEAARRVGDTAPRQPGDTARANPSRGRACRPRGAPVGAVHPSID